jgi:TetR/AcrR family transcriptional regulator, multidrug resistance operon repressor
VRIRDSRKEKAIRDQALAMIVKHGFDGLSMQKLARAAKVSPATIYIYYKDREDLILKLYAEISDKMFAATLKDFDPGMPFDQGLKVQWINRARYFMECPAEMHFMEQIRFSPLYERALKTAGPKYADIMKAFVCNAIQRKQLIQVPVEVYWSIAFAPLYQLVKFHMHGKGFRGLGPFTLDDKTMQLTLNLVLKALKP